MTNVNLRFVRLVMKDLRLSKKDVILPEPSGQNLQSLIKFGDTGSGSGMTKFSLLVSSHPFWTASLFLSRLKAQQ